MLRPQTKPNTKLSAIVDHLAQYNPTAHGDLTQAVSGISMNSKTVESEDLYAAVAGAQHHGADYIAEAVEAGATAILTDRSGIDRVPADLPCIVVEDVRSALVTDAAGASLPHCYAVTCTPVTPTPTYIPPAFRAALGHTTGVIGTIEPRIAGSSIPSEFTTPEAPDLHSLIARMRESGVEVASMEVSSHAMAYKRTYGVPYGVAGFTNLTQDHLDLHGSMSEYFRAKATLFHEDHSQVRVVTLNGGAEPKWGLELAQHISYAVFRLLGKAAVTGIPTQPTIS